MPLNEVLAYINESIESVKCQTYKNFELLIIKEKSTENLDKIINFHSKNDKRIKIITKRTRDICNLKNLGLLEAKGKFITFMEAGDVLEKEFLEKMIKIQNKTKADIVSTELIEDKPYKKIKEINIYENSEVISAYLKLKIRSHSKAKLYKKELFKDITFPYSKYDNFLTTYKIFHIANIVVHSNIKLYNYIIEKNETIKESEHMKKISGCIEILEFIEKNYPHLINECKSKICFEAIDLSKKVKNEKNKKLLFEYIKIYRKYAINDLKVSTKLRFEAVKSLLGYKLFSLCVK